MARNSLFEERLDLTANRHDMRTAGVEAAAGRRIERAWDLANEYGLAPAIPWIVYRHGRQQRLRVWMARRRI
jgi:hypothetical protein